MAKKKEVTGYVRLVIEAGKATPQPPIGSALGPRGVNIMEFCKAFNAKTQPMPAGTPVRVLVTVYKDRSFEFSLASSPASYMIRKAASVVKGSNEAGKKIIATIPASVVYDIAKQKMDDMTVNDLEAAYRSIRGTAQSMGVAVDESA
jgi:large subunit ribosomal protein L11